MLGARLYACVTSWDHHEIGIVRSQFTDVEREVWRGHTASHSEQGIETGFQPNGGIAQSLHSLIALRQHLLQGTQKLTPPISFFFLSFLFFQVEEERPRKEKDLPQACYDSVSETRTLCVRVLYAYSLCLQLQRRAESWRHHGKRRDGC